jgi:DNA-binding beta-propeller fold protein YncE
VLIADDSGNQILIVTPAGQIVWSLSLTNPDDAFFTSNGKDIIVTQEDHQMISLVNIATKQFIWRYGTPEVGGSGPNQVDNPDDALLLPNNYVIFGDIKNCSVNFLKVGSQVPFKRIGLLTHYCYHNPPYRFGSPNGAFPLTDGNFLITEINGDWVDEMTPSGQILWSTHPPGIVYPSDTNEVSPGVYLTVDYSTAGQLIKFNQQGQLLWKYTPTTADGQLNHPSLCEPIPTNGYILCNDDYNDRVIVINPTTNTIVWQYGHKGVAGSTNGYLNEPDGVDLAPPYSLLIRNAPTIGSATSNCWPNNSSSVCTYGINATSSGTG